MKKKAPRKKTSQTKKPNPFFEGVKQGLEEALAFARGEGDPSPYKVHVPEDLDAKAIRKAKGLPRKKSLTA
jgi:hypothetical protein